MCVPIHTWVLVHMCVLAGVCDLGCKCVVGRPFVFVLVFLEAVLGVYVFLFVDVVLTVYVFLCIPVHVCIRVGVCGLGCTCVLIYMLFSFMRAFLIAAAILVVCALSVVLVCSRSHVCSCCEQHDRFVPVKSDAKVSVYRRRLGALGWQCLRRLSAEEMGSEWRGEMQLRNKAIHGLSKVCVCFSPLPLCGVFSAHPESLQPDPWIFIFVLNRL